jgi:hypothetical protein
MTTTPAPYCIWCETAAPAVPARCHGDAVEYECSHCGERYTRRPGCEDAVFVFFPGDIAAAFSRTDFEPISLPLLPTFWERAWGFLTSPLRALWRLVAATAHDRRR